MEELLKDLEPLEVLPNAELDILERFNLQRSVCRGCLSVRISRWLPAAGFRGAQVTQTRGLLHKDKGFYLSMSLPPYYILQTKPRIFSIEVLRSLLQNPSLYLDLFGCTLCRIDPQGYQGI